MIKSYNQNVFLPHLLHLQIPGVQGVGLAEGDAVYALEGGFGGIAAGAGIDVAGERNNLYAHSGFEKNAIAVLPESCGYFIDCHGSK